MKLVKTNKPKYPYKVTFNNGRTSPIPSQHKFKTSFIAHHGCSLVAFYIALRFVGKKKTMTALLRWSKSHLSYFMASKLRINGVCAGINTFAPSHAIYYEKPIYDIVLTALKADKLVLLETKDPIHTNVLFKGSGNNFYNASDGRVKKINVKNMVNRATDNRTYRGCVIVEG